MSPFTWFLLKSTLGASLAEQWMRTHLTGQGTPVGPLVREDPTCRGATAPLLQGPRATATEPSHHKYWSLHALGPSRHNWGDLVPQLLKLACPRASKLQLMSPHAAITKAHTPRACALPQEATAMRSPHTATREQAPPSACREHPCTATKTQCSHK